MKKLFITLFFVTLCAASACLLGACGGGSSEPVDISSEAQILTADGVSYAYAEIDSAAAKDLSQLNVWYTDYYKELRDSGEIVSLVVRYSDDPDHATLFTGINVYTGCEIDSENNAGMDPHETWYHTESDRDRVLFEVEE